MIGILNGVPQVGFTIDEDPWNGSLFRSTLGARQGKVETAGSTGWVVIINPEWLARSRLGVEAESLHMPGRGPELWIR